MKNLKISVKLLISFSIAIMVGFTITIAATFGMLNLQMSSEDTYKKDLMALQSISDIREAFQQERVYFRDMLIYIDDPARINASIEQVNKSHLKGDAAVNRYLESMLDPSLEAPFIEVGGLLNPPDGAYYVAKELIMQSAKDGDVKGVLAGIEAASNYVDIIEKNLMVSEENHAQWAENHQLANKNRLNSFVITMIVISLAALPIEILLCVYMSRLITKPIKNLVTLVRDVSEGNLNVNIDSSAKDETGILAKGFFDVVNIFNSLVTNVNQVAHNHETGDLEHLTIDESAYKGKFKDIAEAINKTVDNMNNDTLYVIKAVSEIKDGNFNFDVKKLPGQKIILTDSLQGVKDNLINFNNDIISLIKDVSEGDLGAHVDSGAYKGNWYTMADELNSLLATITEPISEVSSVLGYVSAGNFDHRMNGNYKGDFLTLKESINTTITNIASYIDEISMVLHNLSKHDLNQEITREYTGSFTKIKDELNMIINTFNTVIGNITYAAEQVSTGASSISESSMTIAAGATEQASSIEELNATIQTINESTTRNAENTKDAEELSNNSRDNASKGDENMKNMLSSMSGIKDSSSKISKIIKVIEDIAFQTNLLALNAAVEAARAGEHGKGFAVVAEEVRTLASRSQTAAKETAVLIEESISRVEEGTQIADKTAEALRTVMDDIGRIADIITNIAGASHEQAKNLAQAVQGLNQITTAVQNNSATSEESASASQELAGQAQIMRNLVSVYNLKK